MCWALKGVACARPPYALYLIQEAPESWRYACACVHALFLFPPYVDSLRFTITLWRNGVKLVYTSAMKTLGYTQLTIRLPNDVYAAIGVLADEEMRSLNSQIMYLLRQALTAAPTAKSVSPKGLARGQDVSAFAGGM